MEHLKQTKRIDNKTKHSMKKGRKRNETLEMIPEIVVRISETT